ncbi:carbohydrate esterase family 5 protein [Aureobasidium subglaciale EXF-2481]|uniref:Carbohydrate esterase family 5 protein n=1 Tax=Aureobasidium subglaciale (strain EXF-2481) TaxID=1043005 RepID=A0A074YS29_AURSE|nr:carbohydrate esterase family 5 protein [Aureobasidium subglaciale EXF-2481]KAI5205498.1 alpha/beta-hydrolase [Aureobasidium subglaciale]KAI5224604.1 alpha/beta-hydrolase [Aureobasidium subglaciale]KAI5227853.1 alpha/beta-hydrolase [Aureobasidium subglaciale]KAI5263324.1 alpha/beta-hydrolase [Aureobasidium subglaciale]KEQ98974.1 carbohydrate esterase family 5 protein [Aureobasidium subglaciale EXF-2481]
MSPRSVTLLSALLAISGTVSSAPAPIENRADIVTATINGVVVSWENNWNVPAQSTPPAVIPPPASTANNNNNGGDWITATWQGNVFSWQANAPTAAPASTPAQASVVSTNIPAPAPTAQNTDSSCRDVHVFLSKGWNEPYPGRQGKLAGAICYGLESCDYEDILYSNPEGSDYCTAVSEGDRNGIDQMTAYANKCPGSKLVLTGYSQGANVAGDILGGADVCGGPNPGLDPSTSPGNKLGAVLLFGDNRHVANQPYNVLSGASVSCNDPRTPESLARLNKFAGVMRSYCDGSDPVCAAAGPGPFDVNKHLNYFDIYTDDAAGWVKYMLGY